MLFEISSINACNKAKVSGLYNNGKGELVSRKKIDGLTFQASHMVNNGELYISYEGI